MLLTPGKICPRAIFSKAGDGINLPTLATYLHGVGINVSVGAAAAIGICGVGQRIAQRRCGDDARKRRAKHKVSPKVGMD